MAFGYREETDSQSSDESALIVPSNELLPDQRKFINGFMQARSIRGAYRVSKINYLYHYRWLENDANYQAAFMRIKGIMEEIEAEGIKTRASKGWLEPLSYKGLKTGQSIRRFSDSLALGYMKSVDPRWRDGNQIQVGPAKLSIEIVQAGVPTKDETEIVIGVNEQEPTK